MSALDILSARTAVLVETKGGRLVVAFRLGGMGSPWCGTASPSEGEELEDVFQYILDVLDGRLEWPEIWNKPEAPGRPRPIPMPGPGQGMPKPPPGLLDRLMDKVFGS